VWSTENGKISSFSVEQTADTPNNKLRPHHLEIALFDAQAGGVPKYRTTVHADVAGATTKIDALVGQAAPACLFINYNDHVYAKTALDKTSLEFFKQNVEKFDDTLMRQLVWSSFLNMVRDAQWPSQEFLALIESKVGLETDPKLTQFIIRAAEATLANYLPDELQVQYSNAFFDLAVKQLKSAKTQDDRIVWARTAIGVARSKENVERLLEMVDKGTGVSEFELDQDMRWSVTQKAAAYAIPGSEERGAKEAARDPSDRGQRAMECLKVCAPDASVKEAAWDRFINDKQSSMKMINAAMSGFHWRHQSDLLKPFINKFFDSIHDIFKTREFAAAENFYLILFAGYRTDDEMLHNCEAKLKTLDPAKDTVLVRCLKESIDDIKRSQACHVIARAYAANKK
jgi:aminopeptidase N